MNTILAVSSFSSILAFATLVNVRNKKDQLYNDIISHLHLKMQDEVEFLGKKLVKTLRDVLYIDVHLLREPYQLQSTSNRSVIIMYHNYQSIVEDKL